MEEVEAQIKKHEAFEKILATQEEKVSSNATSSTILTDKSKNVCYFGFTSCQANRDHTFGGK